MVTLTDLIPAHRLLRMQAASDRAMGARLRSSGLIGTTDGLTVTLAVDFEDLAAEATVAAGRLERLGSDDRHTRAIAAAELAGLTGIRDALTANA